MTSHSLARIIAEELARVKAALGSFDANQPGVSFDGVIPGFGLRVHPSGRRSYLVQTRIGGRMRTITLGNTAVLSEAVARDVARRVILRIDLGLDVVEERKQVRRAPLFETFLEYYWQTCSPSWKPSTRRVAENYRSNIVGPGFKGRFLDEITHADALRWHAQVTRSNGPGAANRALEIVRAAFQKAEQWGYIPEHTNPFWSIRRNRPRKFERFLSGAEMQRLGAALKNARETNPLPATAILLLALTGCRRGEIASLTWGEVRGLRLKLADSKTGPRIVWLGEEARALLDRLPRSKNELRVFPPENMVSKIQNCWTNVKKEAGIGQLRLHDLRHSYASFAARQSESLIMIGNLLGHVRPGTTMRYAHLDDQTALDASSIVGNTIQQWLRSYPDDRQLRVLTNSARPFLVLKAAPDASASAAL